jgi:hypothetical protein
VAHRWPDQCADKFPDQFSNEFSNKQSLKQPYNCDANYRNTHNAPY